MASVDVLIVVLLSSAFLWNSPVHGVDLSSVCKGLKFGTYPHPNDCQQYVLCVLGNPVLLSCPGGYVFHPEVQFCVQESQYHCNVTDTTASPEVTTTTTPEPSTTLVPECDHRPSWESFFCDDARRTLVANPMNCTQYIHCQLKVPSNQLCRNGTVFNDLYQDCLPGDRETCTLASVREDFCRNRTDGAYAHPFLCNRFVMCVRGELQLESCPPFYVFDPSAGHCVKGSAVTCSSLLKQ
uniref:Chitin-binding type-2 domain-containing protein n=1 Tax=Anopheles epiroticus TaxID=199890 RepID=A0A182PN31_9DIPT